ncbi:Leucine zipper protein 2 [Bagarius yarrelli]|uniref:Leucine zipper protein 2 n=1 Tax=Bagarius yarrelli TaxID=175774 RepID=A0A556VKK4_BAGYA|nr:Leucine zipper protein 2 [Bagarius yarrelli]
MEEKEKKKDEEDNRRRRKIIIVMWRRMKRMRESRDEDDDDEEEEEKKEKSKDEDDDDDDNDYEMLGKKLKEAFTERTGILRQLSKTSKELESIKTNMQSMKNDDFVPKKDVQRILDLSHKQREEMRLLQAALQKQVDEAVERAEKHQATIKFLKMEMEKKTKIIKDLQQESKRIQAQLKELRYGKKDLIFKVSV